MPQFKFGENDVFQSTIKAHPKFTLSLYHNLAYINNRVQGQNVSSGEISLYEINVDKPADDLAKGVIVKGENSQEISFDNVTSSAGYADLPAAGDIISAYPLTSSIIRELIIRKEVLGITTGYHVYDGVTEKNTVFKVLALKNTYDHYRPLSKYFDFDKYVMLYGGVPINPAYGKGASTVFTESLPANEYTNMFIIPAIFHGGGIKKGSVDLNFYYTGSLLARAQDVNQNGELIETIGPRKGVIGTVLYNEGVILITASYDLHSLTDGYLSPKSGSIPEGSVLSASWKATSSWAHFGAHRSYITSSTDPASSSYAPIKSSYTLTFQGTNKIPVMTMLAHAPKNDLNWSNNPTYIDRTNLTGSYTENFVKQTGSYIYKERENIPIKNTVSSSYYGYEEKFKPQTFISKIGIYDENNELIAVAKLATPVRKTNDRDYTFKLKLDL